ncbi:hypothetical protein CRUP_002694 [Coryphaenoides rupestris]|nr:hypothetical protein CRUP_002694 [Coryphaenoides rupestris]
MRCSDPEGGGDGGPGREGCCQSSPGAPPPPPPPPAPGYFGGPSSSQARRGGGKGGGPGSEGPPVPLISSGPPVVQPLEPRGPRLCHTAALCSSRSLRARSATGRSEEPHQSHLSNARGRRRLFSISPARCYDDDGVAAVESKIRLPECRASTGPHIQSNVTLSGAVLLSGGPSSVEGGCSPGIQPTGVPHLGNYLGPWRPGWPCRTVPLGACTASWTCTSITLPQDPAQLRLNILDMAACLLACGIDPQRSILFSSPGGWRGRYKREAMKSQKDEGNMGLFTYPVLQAADILLYK